MPLLPRFLRNFEQRRRLHIERQRDVPKRDDRNVLLTTFHGAHMRAVDTHFRGQRGLAEVRPFPVILEIAAKNLPDIHPVTKNYRVLRCDAL